MCRCWPPAMDDCNAFTIPLIMLGGGAPIITLFTSFIPDDGGVYQGPIPKETPLLLCVIIYYIIFSFGLVLSIMGCICRRRTRTCFKACTCCNVKHEEYTHVIELDNTHE